MTIAFDLRPIMSGNISGVETYAKNVLDELLKLDKKNTYILYTNSYKDISKNLPKYKQKNVIYVNTRIPSKLFNITLRTFGFPKIDKMIEKKCGIAPDIFFCPDPRPTPLKSAKKITVIHDLCFKHFPEYFSRKSRIWFKYLLNIEKELKESEKIIAVSNYTKNDLIKTYNVPADKIKTIYEGAGEHLKVKNNQKAVLRKYKIPKDYFLMLSTIEPRKNTNNVVKAFKKAKIKDMYLVVAGKENKKIFKEYQPEKGKNVKYIGFVDELDKATIIKNAKGFIYMSLFEGFGLPATEAMYFGIPTLVSNTTSLKEIGELYALTANPNDIEDMTAKIKLLKDYRQKYPPYSWEKCAKETLEVITQA